MAFRSSLTLGALSSTSSSSSVPTLGVSVRQSLTSRSFSQNHGMASDRKFVDMMKEHIDYGRMFRSPTYYDIKLVHGITSHVHWYLLIKMKDSDLPYISLEITTRDLKKVTQTIRSVEGLWSHLLTNDPTNVGTYKGSFHDICSFADTVVSEMGDYNLLTNNCQNFCNKLLLMMGVIQNPYPTTFQLEEASDIFSVVVKKAYDFGAGVFGEAGAFVLRHVVNAPSQSHINCMHHLRTINDILKPLASNWKVIGVKLLIGDATLNQIEDYFCEIPDKTIRDKQCLHEVLVQYLSRDLINPYVQLSEAIQYCPADPRVKKILDRITGLSKEFTQNVSEV